MSALCYPETTVLAKYRALTTSSRLRPFKVDRSWHLSNTYHSEIADLSHSFICTELQKRLARLENAKVYVITGSGLLFIIFPAFSLERTGMGSEVDRERLPQILTLLDDFNLESWTADLRWLTTATRNLHSMTLNCSFISMIRLESVHIR